MKVVCIYKGKNIHITIGRSYDTIDIAGGIINDNDELHYYPSRYFVNIKEYRKLKLEKISRSSLIEPEI